MAQIEGAIQFKNNPHKVFYTGSPVFGEVIISVGQTIDVSGIKIILSGKAHVFISDVKKKHMASQNEKTECSRYMAKQDYFESVTYVFGSPNGQHQLNEGQHTFKFFYNLPNELPSSMEGHFGRIRYYAKAVLEFSASTICPMAFTTHFIVHKVTDLNFEPPMIKIPSSGELQEQFLCWICASNSLIMQVSIPYSGYVCGQNIPVQIAITNKSGKFVHLVVASLHLIVNYKSEFPSVKTSSEEFTVKKVQTNLLTNEMPHTLNVTLKVPSAPPTLKANVCRIIQLAYEVRVRAFVKGSDKKLIIALPVIIGNIPLRNLKKNSMSVLNGSAYVPKNPEVFVKDLQLDPIVYEEASYMRWKKLPEYPIYLINPQNLSWLSL